MGSYNKATAAALSGAAVVVITALLKGLAHYDVDVTLSGALQTIITTGLVWAIPNLDK